MPVLVFGNDYSLMEETLALPFNNSDSQGSNTRSITEGAGFPAPKSGISFGRDEMNLAEFPLTVLSTRSDPNIKTLEFSDTIYDRNGKPIVRQWIITGADKFGLPTSSDDEVLLGLLKLTVDRGFESRKIYFTRYELLRALRWTTEGRSYQRLQNALDRLSGVRVKASNAFFDNEMKAHSTRNFGILDGYEINDGRENSRKRSFFTWSEVLFKSFQVGFIKKLDLDFYLGLTSAVSRRLYRYLDKHYWYKSKIQINLFTLAHEKIGISRNYKYASSIRQQIDPAIEELMQRGFLSNCEYIGRGKATEVIFYAATRSPRVKQLAKGERSVTNSEAIAEERTDSGSINSESPTAKLVLELIERGIQKSQAIKLLESKQASELQRIQKIIKHYDNLMSQYGQRFSNPVGWLYRAVQRFETFVLPGESRQADLKFDGAKKNNPLAKSTASRTANAEEIKSRYLIWLNQQTNKALEEIEPSLLKKITQEIELSLGNIRKSIEPETFQEMVKHGVHKKVAQIFQIADFREWLAFTARQPG